MTINQKKIIADCKKLLQAYRQGQLGNTQMPEEASPKFSAEQKELCLTYFTLPMSLNYQRDSYKLWQSALATFNDRETRVVFEMETAAGLPTEKLREFLTRYKIALQPQKHIATWQKIAKTIFENWGTVGHLLKYAHYDFLQLKDIIQGQHKKGFPYLSGPKIFHYWCFILQQYGKVKFLNAEFIEIAPDTHITKCSVILGVISQKEAEFLTKEEISARWRSLLAATGINPIEMHPPLWFWSKNNFQFKLN